jgi:type I restriction enzyme S subunit
MSEVNGLPAGWVMTTLNDVGRWCGGGTPSKENPAYWNEGKVPWLSPKDMKAFRLLDSEDHITQFATEETNIKQFPPGTVLFVVRSGILSRTLPVGVSEVFATMNQDLKGITPYPGINPNYLAYYLVANERGILHQCSKDGTTVASIEVGRLREYPVPLAPTSEQARIVEKAEELLSDLDAGVSSLERARANLKKYRAAVLRAAVTGELTAEWRATHPNVEPATKLLDRILAERREKWEAKFTAAGKTTPKKWRGKGLETVRPDTTECPDIPSGWCMATVEQLGAVQLGRQRSPKNRSDKHPTRYIRAANITESGLSLDDLLDMEFTPAEQEIYRLQAGDILLSEASGSPDQVGKPSIWNDEVPNCCFQNTVIRLRPEKLSSRYLLIVFQHFYFNKLFARVAAGVGINHLSAAKFAALTVPVPPLLEQEIIVSEVEQRLSVIEATENYIAASLKRASRLRHSILKEAFIGRLVPQDPADEPASVLLDRARQARAALNGSTGVTRQRSRGRKNDQPELFE